MLRRTVMLMVFFLFLADFNYCRCLKIFARYTKMIAQCFIFFVYAFFMQDSQLSDDVDYRAFRSRDSMQPTTAARCSVSSELETIV